MDRLCLEKKRERQKEEAGFDLVCTPDGQSDTVGAVKHGRDGERGEETTQDMGNGDREPIRHWGNGQAETSVYSIIYMRLCIGSVDPDKKDSKELLPGQQVRSQHHSNEIVHRLFRLQWYSDVVESRPESVRSKAYSGQSGYSTCSAPPERPHLGYRTGL
ncbi:hypothetical protein BKA67DRAFT_537179 [Truncatella angustata]|uniref:Uncharacterized protein n=1 Tax=Truncatella angustata TaxID=152316 RepID=A0A9P8UJV8_9PEZI|nr:uncharacterized protein BKA67DRAFT_537179 [Truncatella angustata]KAH6653516.1 hypothetical protein BKA67DRAFT_537179 [Truncatella angustata]